MDSLDELLNKVSMDADGGGPSASDLSNVDTIMLEYWTAEVEHLQAQKVRLVRLGHNAGIEAVGQRLAYARKMLESLRG